jgi:hypothetical protein
MVPMNMSFGHILGIFWPIHRQLYSYVARSSEIMVQNNSRGTSTKISTHLARWYVLPYTYPYKISLKNISFCQILGIFWPIHRQLSSHIARSSEIMVPNNSRGTSTKTYYRMESTDFVHRPNTGLVLANTWAIL